MTPLRTTVPQPTAPLNAPSVNNIVINTTVFINRNIWSVAKSTATHLQHINLCIIWLGENGIHCMQQLWRQPQRIIFWLKVGLETVISNKFLKHGTIHMTMISRLKKSEFSKKNFSVFFWAFQSFTDEDYNVMRYHSMSISDSLLAFQRSWMPPSSRLFTLLGQPWRWRQQFLQKSVTYYQSTEINIQKTLTTNPRWNCTALW